MRERGKNSGEPRNGKAEKEAWGEKKLTRSSSTLRTFLSEGMGRDILVILKRQSLGVGYPKTAQCFLNVLVSSNRSRRCGSSLS